MITLDAQNKKLGRFASEIAVLLMGKDTTDYQRNKIPDREIKVVNAGKMDVDERKLTTKEYIHYTGYPGGLKTERMDSLVKRKGYKEALRTAVRGMLPGNKLRPQMLKKLTIED